MSSVLPEAALPRTVGSSLGHQYVVLPGAEPGLDRQILSIVAKLVESLSLDATGIPFLQASERSAPPQPESVRQHVNGTLGFTHRHQLPPPADLLFEQHNIDVVARGRQPVSIRRRLDDVGAEHLPDPHHTALDYLVPRLWRRVSPQGVGQPACTHDSARSERQRFEHHTIAWPDRAAIAVDHDRAKHCDAHPPSVPAALAGVNP